MLQTETQDILQNMAPKLVRASTLQRAMNFFIDFIGFYFTVTIVLIIAILIYPPLLDQLMDYTQLLYNNPEAVSAETSLMNNIIGIFIYAVYMSIIEALFKGKSLGKLVTGTRAVNLDGSRISTQTAFARGLSRAPIPFSFFSAIGIPCNPWQDRWTKTMVIDERASGRRR